MARLLALALLLLVLGTPVATGADRAAGRVGPSLALTPSGRALTPAGRLTELGNFPSGGALAPSGRFYWAVDSGLGRDDVKVVDVVTGAVIQTLALPGAYGAVAFAPDGATAYVSGEPQGDVAPQGQVKGAAGEVIHVYSVDTRTGLASERDPIAVPNAPNHSGLGWPIGLGVTPDGRRLVVALNQGGSVAIVDLASRAVRYVGVEPYPYGVAISRDGGRAFVTSEASGTVDVIDLERAALTKTIGVGGALPNAYAHPQAILADPRRDRAYVAVTSRDLVAVVDTARLEVSSYVDVGQTAPGTAPVGLALSPKGDTLYAADSGEDAIAVIALANGKTSSASSRGKKRTRRATRAGAAPAPVLIGRIPTAAYPTDVAVTPDGRRLVWIAAKGLGAGPNLAYRQFAFNAAAYGSYTPEALTGRLGMLAVPRAATLRKLTAGAQRQVVPANSASAPAGSPVVGAGGGASTRIKYVFYIVRENRTYDQIFGTDPRGDGDPHLELFDDNGASGPAAGVTPNVHKLVKTFPLLDHVYSNSEVSVDGHPLTAGGYAIDHIQRGLHANYGNRGRIGDFADPISYPPRHFLFDQAVRQGVSFRNYGEGSAGTVDDGRPTYSAVTNNTSKLYAAISLDAGALGGGQPADVKPLASHSDQFQLEFRSQLLAGTVPHLNYLTLPLDHTFGSSPPYPTPKAFVADNDLGLGQIVELISHSSIWPQTAIFVVEDDAQDGADHVDAHRMPAFVISPWAARRAVVHTRYDHYSVIRTIELILGLRPLSLNDSLATPMYDAFAPTSDVEGTRFNAVRPEQLLTELNTPQSPDARLSNALPFDRLDLVPEALSDRILWHSVYGAASRPPAPGPNASPAEHARAVGALRVYRAGGDVRAWLARHAGVRDGDEGIAPGATWYGSAR